MKEIETDEFPFIGNRYDVAEKIAENMTIIDGQIKAKVKFMLHKPILLIVDLHEKKLTKNELARTVTGWNAIHWHHHHNIQQCIEEAVKLVKNQNYEISFTSWTTGLVKLEPEYEPPYDYDEEEFNNSRYI